MNFDLEAIKRAQEFAKEAHDKPYINPRMVDSIEVSPKPARVRLLNEAADIITGDRNKTYGEPMANFTNTARIWNAQLGHKLKAGEQFEPEDVAALMIGLKLARWIASPKRDTALDIAGYSGCLWEVAESRGATNSKDEE